MMAGEKADVLLLGPKKSLMVDAFIRRLQFAYGRGSQGFRCLRRGACTAHPVRIAISAHHRGASPAAVDGAGCRGLEINFDLRRWFMTNIETKWAGEHGITVNQHAGCAQRGGLADTALGFAVVHGAGTAAGRAVSLRARQNGWRRATG